MFAGCHEARLYIVSLSSERLFGPYVLSGGPLIFTFSFFSQGLLVSMKIFDLPRTEEEAVVFLQEKSILP